MVKHVFVTGLPYSGGYVLASGLSRELKLRLIQLALLSKNYFKNWTPCPVSSFEREEQRRLETMAIDAVLASTKSSVIEGVMALSAGADLLYKGHIMCVLAPPTWQEFETKLMAVTKKMEEDMIPCDYQWDFLNLRWYRMLHDHYVTQVLKIIDQRDPLTVIYEHKELVGWDKNKLAKVKELLGK